VVQFWPFKLVQFWTVDDTDWKKSEGDSILVLSFWPRRGGTRLEMIHTNVPDAHAKSITSGWRTYYWKPWKAYLTRRKDTTRKQ
jgi:hypothetical protein